MDVFVRVRVVDAVVQIETRIRLRILDGGEKQPVEALLTDFRDAALGPAP